MDEKRIMNLELKSIRNDTLELTIINSRPCLKIGGLEIDDEFLPWHAQWQNMVITEFDEPYEIVKGRIKKFYDDENVSDEPSGYTVRKPCIGKLFNEKEEWTLQNTRIIECKCDARTRTIRLELTFDGVNYNLKE